MISDRLPVLVPAASEVLLLAICLVVWVKLRRLGLNGVCTWTLAVMALDVCGQVWHLAEHLGKPAGVAWLVHVALSYLMVYVLCRAGEGLWRMRTLRPIGQCAGRALTE